MIFMSVDTSGGKYDTDYIDRLYSEHEQMMYKAAYKILQNKYDAEDAVHNAFLKIIRGVGLSAVKKLDRLNKKAYLTTAAKNEAIRCYNKRKKNQALDIDELYSYGSGESVEDIVFTEMEVERVSEAMLKLSRGDYEILYFSLIMESENKEIAKQLDISEETVRQRIHRAKSRLKKILKEGETANDK